VSQEQPFEKAESEEKEGRSERPSETGAADPGREFEGAPIDPRDASCDVLIVGAGPTGMTLACVLCRYGLRIRLIDAGRGPTPWSKAQVLHARTLEILEQLGIVEPFLARGKPLHTLSMYSQDCKRLFHFQIGEPDSVYPFMLSLSQHDTEVLLIEQLERFGVHIERQTRLVDLRQDIDGVSAYVQRASDGSEDSIRTRYLVGCDGVHSTVRQLLGIEYGGSTYRQRVLQADVRIDWPLRHAEDEVVGFVSEHGPIGAFPLPGEHRYRLMVFDAGMGPTLENFQFLLDSRGPQGTRVSDPAWMNEYTIHCRMTTRYGTGRVFLAGDAVHTHSPSTGQGMNTGMQDVFNLGWKLGLVLRQGGQPSVLDSYEAERVPVAAKLLSTTDATTRGLNEILTLYNPVAQGLRNALLRLLTPMGMVQRKVSRTLSMLDIDYAQSPIVAEDHSTRATGSVYEEESISLRSWLAFGGGPAPGRRAFDNEVVDVGGKGEERLFSLLSSTEHTLLLFVGVHESEDAYQRVVALARIIRDRYAQRIHPVLVQVSPHPLGPQIEPWDGPLLFDRGGVLHQRYGARADCLYLIRPDGHIGYRSQPADLNKLEAYLQRIFF